MPSLSVKLSFVGLALVLAAAAPADAKSRKHKKHVATHRVTAVTPNCRGANVFPCGPLYNSGDYLGDDPDPFIRSQILRDLGAHYGGELN